MEAPPALVDTVTTNLARISCPLPRRRQWLFPRELGRERLVVLKPTCPEAEAERFKEILSGDGHERISGSFCLIFLIQASI